MTGGIHRESASGGWLRPVRGRLLAAVLGVVIAGTVVLTISSHAAYRLVHFAGYYFTLLVALAFCLCLWRAYRVSAMRKVQWPGVLRFSAVLLPASALFFVHASLDYKIAMDDYLLASTAKHLHEFRTVGYVGEGSYVGEQFIPGKVHVDKRPWFYPFLVSVVHDLTGYREANAFLVNALAGVLFLASAYVLGRRIGGMRGAVLSVLLWLTLPLLSQNATGAGMEMVNLLLMQALILLSIRYLDAPDRASEGALSLAAVLLAYTRYESALFILPVALVIVAGWYRGRRVQLSWGTVLAAPLLLAVAVQNRIYSETESSWELIDGAVRPFSLAHVAENFPHALHFFFSTGDGLANSLLLSLIGFPCVLMFGLMFRTEVRAFWKDRVEGLVLGLFGVFLLLHLAVILSFHASKFDSLYVSRYALPIHVLLVPATAMVLHAKVKRAIHWKGIFTVAGLFLLVFAQPNKAKAIYSRSNFFVREMNWLYGHSEAGMAPKSLIIDRYGIPWSLREWPVRQPEQALERTDALLSDLESSKYPEIFLVDRLHYSGGSFVSRNGSVRNLVDVLDVDLIEERSFRQLELTRLYRVLGPAMEKENGG